MEFVILSLNITTMKVEIEKESCMMKSGTEVKQNQLSLHSSLQLFTH